MGPLLTRARPSATAGCQTATAIPATSRDVFAPDDSCGREVVDAEHAGRERHECDEPEEREVDDGETDLGDREPLKKLAVTVRRAGSWRCEDGIAEVDDPCELVAVPVLDGTTVGRFRRRLRAHVWPERSLPGNDAG